MMTANQLYKTSGSDLAFKEWLKREQLKGNLNVEEKKEFLNAGGNARDIVPMPEEGEDSEIIFIAEKKKVLRNGLLMGIVIGVAGKVIFDKFYKKV